MPDTYDLILKGGTVVNHDGEGVRDIGIVDGKIAALGHLARASAGEVIDCAGPARAARRDRHPGAFPRARPDPQGRPRDRLARRGHGRRHRRVRNAQHQPDHDERATLADKIARARHRMHCDFAFFIGGTRENTNELPDLERLPGCAGVKVFIGSSTGALLVEDDEALRRVLEVIRRRASFHSEDEFRLRERQNLRVAGDPRSHPVWRDELVALTCTKRLVRIARETGKRVHVLHITTKQEMAFLEGAQGRRVGRSHAAPSHARGARLLRAAGRVRPDESAGARRDPQGGAVATRSIQGIVDVLGSDHAPHTREEKEKPYPQTPSGMTGVQTLVPIMLDHVNAGRLTLQRFVDLTSAGPAAAVRHRLQGAHRGRLRCRPHRRRSQAARDDHQ